MAGHSPRSQSGGVFESAGDLPKAIAADRRAIKIFEALATATRTSPSTRTAWVTSFHHLGNALIGIADIRGAVEAYRLAIESRSALAAASPDVPEYRARTGHQPRQPRQRLIRNG